MKCRMGKRRGADKDVGGHVLHESVLNAGSLKNGHGSNKGNI